MECRDESQRATNVALNGTSGDNDKTAFKKTHGKTPEEAIKYGSHWEVPSGRVYQWWTANQGVIEH